MHDRDDADTPLFHVYKSGKLTVVGFDGKHLANPDNAPTVQGQLLELLSTHACQLLAVDLMEVEIVSSWILGILAAIQQGGISVQLYHPNATLQDVLETTQLHSILKVRESLVN